MRRPLRLRRYLVTGLVVIMPLALTFAVLKWTFEYLDRILGAPLQRAIGLSIPGLGFILLLLLLLTVGWAAHLTVGRRLIATWNQLLGRFPLTSRLYNAISQIVQAVAGTRRQFFIRCVLVPYPHLDAWAVAFVTAEDAGAASEAVGEPCATVFMPTTPNPTTGFLMVVPQRLIRDLPISLEEAIKLVMSAGAVLPSGGPRPPGPVGLDLDRLLAEKSGGA